MDGQADSGWNAERMPPGSLVGSVVGGFVLESLLGAGGMAEVYRGIDLGLEREVAVKILPPPLAQFPIYVARFRDEARAVAALQSPRIVPIFQFGEEAGLLYIVMPILADSLRGKLQREGLPPVEIAVRLVTQIAEALDTAHAAGIIHRDVKPENILLDTHNQPLLSDFGIARDLTNLHGADASRPVTATGMPVGTPQYMSPEQLRQQPLDQRSDVYSLGVVLYELLTGELPHAAPTAYEVVASVLTRPVEPPSVLNPALWPALDVVALTALASDPAARYRTARDFALSLQDALVGDRQPRGARDVSTPRAGEASMPGAGASALLVPASVPAPVSVPLSADISQYAVTLPPRRADPAELWVLGNVLPPPPKTRQRQRRQLALVGLAAVLVVLLALVGTLLLGNGADAPGLAFLPLPGFAASLPSPTATSSPSGTGGAPASGTPGATTTPGTMPGATPSVTPTGSPLPSPSASPSPDTTPTPTPSLVIAPSVWQLGNSHSSSGCTSVPSDTGYTTVSQTISNNGAAAVSWSWQSASPALPGSFQYQINGGLWSLGLLSSMPSDLLAAGATDTLNIRLACTATDYSVQVVAGSTQSSAQSTYLITVMVPG